MDTLRVRSPGRAESGTPPGYSGNGYAPVRASTRKGRRVDLNRIADSFSWPFRGSWRQPWLIGVIAILFLPLTFVLVLGYAVAAVRAPGQHPGPVPPAWPLSPARAADTPSPLALSAPVLLG